MWSFLNSEQQKLCFKTSKRSQVYNRVRDVDKLKKLLLASSEIKDIISVSVMTTCRLKFIVLFVQRDVALYFVHCTNLNIVYSAPTKFLAQEAFVIHH